uniref:uncharacterized protein n=1 Tax=Myxine glutinosa TaxID=7769 RepID=UPI00358EE1E4
MTMHPDCNDSVLTIEKVCRELELRTEDAHASRMQQRPHDRKCKQRARAEETEDDHASRLQRQRPHNRKGMQRARAEETEDDHASRLQRQRPHNRKGMQRARAEETEDDHASRLQRQRPHDRKCKQRARAEETEDDHASRLQQQRPHERKCKQTARAEETEDEHQCRLQYDRQQHKKTRCNEANNLARNAQGVLLGTQEVGENNIGALIKPDGAATGETPRFAQIYVHDPQHDKEEAFIRLGNIQLPATTSTHQQNMLLTLLQDLQTELHKCNLYIHDFKQVCEIPSTEIGQARFVINENSRPQGEHVRRCNRSFMEVSVLMGDELGRHDLILQLRGGGLHTISDTHRSADPLHFVLLFPGGTDGWHLGLNYVNPQTGQTMNKRIVAREFYAYHIQQRLNQSDALFRSRHLFQEYCCMAFATAEKQRLYYLQNNQKALRVELHNNLCDMVHAHDIAGTPGNPVIGKCVILPPSFAGGPRHMHHRLQDAMAIVRKYHKPDLFITFTCNPNWQEIKDVLLVGQNASDRPDIVANHKWMADRAILAPNNTLVDTINEVMSDTFPGTPTLCQSADKTVNDDDATRFPTEYLNFLNIAGMPPHQLSLKDGMPLILLRNLNPKQGLCNGTRLIVKDVICGRLLKAIIANGDNAGRSVFIPRITLQPTDGIFPFHWQRRQFPVRIAFAMTINKSQGQSLSRVCLWLEQPVFKHGQLYVGSSRVGHPDNIRFAIKQLPHLPRTATCCIVYSEVLSLS